jgi:hypothetical protein
MYKNMKKILPSLLTLFSISFAYAGETPQTACNQYYQLMQSLPHIKVTYEKNKKFTSFENKPYNGCSVQVETKWSLVGKDFNLSSVLELPDCPAQTLKTQ